MKGTGRPRLLLTPGDPNGVGPEALLRAFASSALSRCGRPIVVGGWEALRSWRHRLDLDVRLRRVRKPGEARCEPGVLEVLDDEEAAFEAPRPGVVEARAGIASAVWLERAARLVTAGAGDAIVTGPVCKEALASSGRREIDQTEILGRLFGVRRVGMVACAGRLRVLLATGHESLRGAIASLDEERLDEAFDLAAQALVLLGLPGRRIALAALNPHAGEGGLFGSEEKELLAPAVARARARGIEAFGPLPADSVFHRVARGEFELAVALTHDQGLIAVKTAAFERAATAAVGLPIVRTGVIHGAGLDLAGRRPADPRGFLAAAALAARIARRGYARSLGTSTALAGADRRRATKAPSR